MLGWGNKKTTTTKQEEQDEMSMEEILASIRRYVSEDQKTRDAEPHKQEAKASPYHSPYADYPAPTVPAEHAQYTTSSPIDTGYDPYAQKKPYITETHKHPQEHEQHHHKEPINEQMSYTALKAEEKMMEKAMERVVEKAAEEIIRSEVVAAPETVSASAAALNRLIEANRTSLERELSSTTGVLTLEKLMMDLARPLIREWIDHNMTRIVEKMVAHEIEKITKHLRP